jgi:hypothetical protein
MSYCRWSSDDFKCDLYCYQSSQGYTTHVAANRVIGDVPHIDWDSFLDKRVSAKEFVAQHQAQHEFLMNAKREPIGLEEDGKSYDDPDLESFLLRVLHLKALGYQVPEYVTKAIIEEINEETLQRAANHNNNKKEE